MLFGVAPLAMIIPRFWDFSRGEIRYVWISPGEKCAPVALLLGRKSQVLHFSWEKIRICLIYPRAKSTSDICGFLPGGNPTYADYSREEFWTCCISPREKYAPVGFLPGRHFNLSHFPRGEIHFCCLMYHQDTPTSKYVPCVRGTIQVIWSKSFIDK
jgi:hypothetical protein